MKRLFAILVFCCYCTNAKADHITGGEMYYTYLGKNGNNYEYEVTLKLFMRCFSGRQFNNPAIISVFDRITNIRLEDIQVALTSQENISINDNNPCITNPPLVCYDVGYYIFNVSLPGNPNGYILAGQVNYRISGINNLVTGYNQIGATYTAEIPGTIPTSTAPVNNSARFTGSDLVIVCAGNAFTYSFAATDTDGDLLAYSFCGAYQSNTSGLISPPIAPPYQYVPYGQGYTHSTPLGNDVTINSQTGMISGIAPPSGVYVVTVCVNEIRNGVVIATQRKDLQISITECSVAAALLEPEYLLCKETTSLSISNISNSPLITSYQWQVSNQNGDNLFTSANEVMNFNFADTGIYSVKLLINPGQQCNDSTTAIIRVFPGLVADFEFAGQCITKPTQFSDQSITPYGIINNWNWNFDANISGFSFTQHPLYTYSNTGIKQVELIVGTSKGCRDTISKSITIFEKPPLSLITKDTLICNGDSIQLGAVGQGNFFWSSANEIIDAGSATPTVFPDLTGYYYVNLDDNGCINSDSVRVRVVDFVSLQMKPDSVICLGDTIHLGALSDALKFSWTPSGSIEAPSQLFSPAYPSTNTVYELTASIGHCSATGSYQMFPVPYPFVHAGFDTTICYGTDIMLNGQSDGYSFSWTPASTLSGAQTLNPVANPFSSTSYILTAYGNQGCPKPSRDTVLITVMPKINAFAGNDTSVVTNQPLHLQASGGVQYLWDPPDFLSLISISDPIAVFDENIESIRYSVLVFDEAGCYDSASVMVTIFKTPPVVFVPSAFTPNNDGKNDVIRPIAAGMSTISYFRIFNRWGQLVFSTNENGKGWNGRINGILQKTDNYIWEVKATDFYGNSYFQKGVFTLVR